LADRQARADAKEAAKAYTASRMDETEELNRDIAEREKEIESLLSRALDSNPFLDVSTLRERYVRGVFRPAPMGEEPQWRDHEPPPLSWLSKLFPGGVRRHQQLIIDAKSSFDRLRFEYLQRILLRETERKQHDDMEQTKEAEIAEHNNKIDALSVGLYANDHAAYVEYYSLLVTRSLGSEVDAIAAEVGYAPESRHLVVDLELPSIDLVPEEASHKYVKSGDRIEVQARPLAKRRALYASLVNQAVLKCVDTVFRGGVCGVECLTINGMLDTIDPANGMAIRPCLLSVRVTADNFKNLNLRQVQPDQCLRALRASVSRSPAELIAVKPIVELNMVDPRFIETRDVLSGLDQRMNLMELTPGEFEMLITNLFAKMGLETRQTQASRDGGVDCVAFDLRPIFGGKVVIQAKRYKNTVGVSAVRDLFGTLQNEGANRGILITTSGYGKASHEFAKGKPLELIDGSGLLYLLAEHAGIEAKIETPSGWVDRSNLEEDQSS